MAHPQSTPRGMVAHKRVDIGTRKMTGNSTAYILDSESSLPSTDQGVAFTMISNSTGVAMAVNTTGTTWKYLSVTSVQAT